MLSCQILLKFDIFLSASGILINQIYEKWLASHNVCSVYKQILTTQLIRNTAKIEEIQQKRKKRQTEKQETIALKIQRKDYNLCEIWTNVLQQTLFLLQKFNILMFWSCSKYRSLKLIPEFVNFTKFTIRYPYHAYKCIYLSIITINDNNNNRTIFRIFSMLKIGLNIVLGLGIFTS
jgi:hypothetical protein